MKKKNKNNSSIGLGTGLLMILLGATCGFVMVAVLDGEFAELGFFEAIAVMLVTMLAAFYVQIILHEAGHLVAGLISGYKFGSFRVGSIMIVKEQGRIKIKKHSLAGTGGQCLMSPPEAADGEYPVIFYNLGGVLMNAVTIPVFAALVSLADGLMLIKVFCVMMALMGYVTATTNGIPRKLGMVNNDGSNALELYKSREARIVFWNQFKMVEEIAKGTRLSQMPSEWFFMPSDEGMKNSITASGAVFLENRLIDSGKLDEALALIDELLSSETALTGIHKNLLVGDKITIELLRGADTKRMEDLYNSREYQAFVKQMKNNISVIRVEYAYELLCKRDSKRAGALLAHFEKCARSHPYSCEAESEAELIRLIEEKSKDITAE